MASSSEESFAWEKASSGSDDDDMKHPKINGEETNVKHEESSFFEEDVPKKKAKRKQRDDENSFDEIESPKKKKIKIELESDVDIKKKKKEKNVTISAQQDDDDYLNLCVKQEQEYQKTPDDSISKKSQKQQEQECEDDVPKKEKKSKKKKKHSSKDITVSNTSDNDLQNNENSSNFIDTSVVDEPEPIKKSPKKKSKESKLRESSDINDKFSAEESEVQNYDDINVTNRNEYDNEEPIEKFKSSNLEDSIVKNHNELLRHKSSKKLLHNSINETSITISQNGSPRKNISIKPTLQSTPNNEASQGKNIQGRLLDRIRFEEDPDSDVDLTLNNKDAESAFLKKYLKQNIHLQPITTEFQNDSGITNDDEIWILKCPHNVDIHKLHNTDFNLDSKSKIKISGETFCGNLDETESKITIMTANENNLSIKNIIAKGTIHFRKRLPKPHFQEDNVMVNNQTDFIPFPETKCRHPLFGPNYKDAIKTRVRRASADSAAAELEVLIAHERKKKKKHKKEHSIKPKIEMDEEEVDRSLINSPKIENESDVPVKKVKKKKHANNDEKKSKRIKVDLDSAEAWESEKAIEENLFNF